MKTSSLLFILLCIAVMAAVWVFAAFQTKRTVKRHSGWGMRIAALIVVWGIIAIQRFGGQYVPIISTHLWSQNFITWLLADAVALCGLLLMLWSRAALGRNWSADITLKENHQLITSGPYAYVRHPIYSGLLLMILSLVLFYANIGGVVLFLLFFFGAYFVKGRREEKMLEMYFPNEYPAYKKRVKALIPYIF